MSTSHFASFTHSPARLRVVARRERAAAAASAAASTPSLRTFGAAQLFVVTPENLPQIDAFCNRRRKEQGARAQATRLARQMQAEIERQTMRERAGRLRVVGAEGSAAAPPAKKPAAAVPPTAANGNFVRLWSHVRGLARL